MGGAIAIDYSLQYPRYLKAIVLVGTGGRLRVVAEILDRYGRGEKMPDLAGQLYGSHASGKMFREGEQYVSQTQPEVWHADFTACNNFDLLSELPRINIPTLVLCGAEDRMTPLKYSRYLAENIAGAKLEIFDGAGHMLMLEKPDEVNMAVQSFLEDLGW
jgi:pimeloyl-ACP methyl ester carboxylesterase